jgi:hypothetical protein
MSAEARSRGQELAATAGHFALPNAGNGFAIEFNV